MYPGVKRSERFCRGPDRRSPETWRSRECYLVSVRSDLDQQTRDLDEAIREVYAFAEGTIVCCVPGVLAYYEGEAPKNRFILHRQSAA